MLEHVNMPEEYNMVVIVRLGDEIYINDNYIGSENIEDVKVVIF